MLSSGAGNVLKLGERFLNILRHGEIHHSGFVVPGKSEARVLCASPISGDGVEVAEGVNKMLGMSTAFILDSELSTTREKAIGLVSWVKRPGVCLVGE